ncbi:MAG: sigma-54-dependent Fis family transcriptional regulator [Chlamydiia bacterium]|nr:sigma-54-dependent Fis family transcriptional regulator [Chlamydiia bacterium]
MKRVLIIEKELSSCELLLHLLREKGMELSIVEDGMRAFDLLKMRPFDLIISDLKGVQTLYQTPLFSQNIPIVQLTQEGDRKHQEVQHTLDKPFSEGKVLKLLGTLLCKQETKGKIIAESPCMQKILRTVETIAKSHSNVFIFGESGTGKEVIAGLIHSASKRKEHPFIRVNCAALPDTLIESEFFGHEKGAFTGALQKRLGRFERADQGTLLLDEISEIPLPLQAKLLRVVQEQEFERVGGCQSIHVDVRLISTSNREMKKAIKEKTFREDLYYRLNVIPIYLPPLRERKEDILPLARHFIEEICKKNQLPLKTLSNGAIDKLMAYSWPGNIRELRNIIEHGVVMDYSPIIEEDHLCISPQKIEENFPPITMKELEKKHILKTLERLGGNRTMAAHQLGISVRTLRNKLKEYGNETSDE